MAGVVPFHELSGVESAAHGELAVSLGAELAPLDPALLDASLAPLVADLAPLRGTGPVEQMLAAETILPHHLRAEPRSHRDLGLADLLPQEVARRRRGHELTVALVALEAARRAGLRLTLVACPTAVFLAHPRVEAPVLLGAAPEWELIDARELDEPELAWQCGHEAASLLLSLILARTRETGHLSAELRASELCLALPLEDGDHERLQLQLASVRARLN
jgi:hypothetical protein